MERQQFNTNHMTEQMTKYLWSEAEKASKKGFDSLFTFCRATKHGFSGNKEKTEAKIWLNGFEKTYKFE